MRVRTERLWAFLLVAMLGCALVRGQEAAAPIKPALTGRAIDETGKAVAGAAVAIMAWEAFVDTASLLANPPNVTADDGSFAIPVADGFLAILFAERMPCKLVVAAANRQASSLRIDPALASTGGDVGDVLLVPGGKLIGRVRDEGGAPVPGARIHVESSIVDRLDFGSRLEAGAITDGQGIFVVPCVPRTGLRLIARADGYVPESRLAAQHSPVDLRLRKAGTVRGKVVDAAGAPLADIQVYAVAIETSEGWDPVRTAADGSFAVSVPAARRFRIGGTERKAPFRSFRSELLRGPGDGVLVTERSDPTKRRRAVDITVADAVDGSPISTFGLSYSNRVATTPALTMLGHYRTRSEYTGSARIEVPERDAEPLFVVVDAAGHGYEIMSVPDDQQTVRVELGAEAILSGTVRDQTTNAPMAGVAVRALPKHKCFGTNAIDDCWPRTDAAGHYRLSGLRPDDYHVQAYASNRPASPPLEVHAVAGDANTLDLVVPEERWIELEVTGFVSTGFPCQLAVNWIITHRGVADVGFDAGTTMPAPQRLTRNGVFRLGPLGNAIRHVELRVPSRTRACTGINIDLGEFEPASGPRTVTLPDVRPCLVRGRVELPHEVATERVGVAAWRTTKARPHSMFDHPAFAALDADAAFVLDVPSGAYCLQLVDLETGLVFHTEANDLAVAGADMPVTLRPEIHWLEISCVPEKEGDDVVLRSFTVRVQRPRTGALTAMLQPSGSSDGAESGEVRYRSDAATQRWLVAPGRIEIAAAQNFEVLMPWARGWNATTAGDATVEIDAAVHRVTMRIPAPPSDEKLAPR